jgi:hypothetical protein
MGVAARGGRWPERLAAAHSESRVRPKDDKPVVNQLVLDPPSRVFSWCSWRHQAAEHDSRASRAWVCALCAPSKAQERRFREEQVARGNCQRPGVDDGESFSSVMRPLRLASIRDLDVQYLSLSTCDAQGGALH